jgi:hypothetical protein
MWTMALLATSLGAISVGTVACTADDASDAGQPAGDAAANRSAQPAQLPQDQDVADTDGDSQDAAAAAPSAAPLPFRLPPDRRAVLIAEAPMDAIVESEVAAILPGLRPVTLRDRAGVDLTRDVVLTYRGKATITDGPAVDPTPTATPRFDSNANGRDPASPGAGDAQARSGDAPAEEPEYVALLGVMVESGNEYSLSIPKDTLEDMVELVPDAGVFEGDASLDPDGDGIEDIPDQTPIERSWSTSVDYRKRIFGLNAAAGGVYRWLVEFSNNCTGAVVGNRQILTAGHCVVAVTQNCPSAPTAVWSFGGNLLSVGRNGSSIARTIQMPSSVSETVNPNPLQNTSIWTEYDTSDCQGAATEWNRRRNDFALITVSAANAFGTQLVYNGQYWFDVSYGFTVSEMLDASMRYYRSGYPMCEASGRIDEPCKDASLSVGWQKRVDQPNCTEQCTDDHIYGESWLSLTQITAAAYPNVTNEPTDVNYALWASHSGDSSPADSGSPLFRHDYGGSNTWRLHGVNIGNVIDGCGATATSLSCGARTHVVQAPLLTPTRAFWIGLIKQSYP